MECYHCGKEIGKEEKFYVINEEYYCQDCVKEHTVTYYTIVDEEEDEPIEECDVHEYYYLEELIDNLKSDISWIKEMIECHKKELSNCEVNSRSWRMENFRVEEDTKKLERLEKELAKLKENEYNE